MQRDREREGKDQEIGRQSDGWVDKGTDSVLISTDVTIKQIYWSQYDHSCMTPVEMRAECDP